MVERQKGLLGNVITIAGLLAMVFLVDWVTPLGYGVWALYFVPILLTTRLPWRQAPLIVTAITTALTIIGALVSPSGVPLEYSSLNRALGISCLWVVGILLTNPSIRERVAFTHISARVLGATISAILLAVGSIAFTFTGVSGLVAGNQMVVHTHEVLTLVHQMRATLTDAEVGERGYLITGDPAHLSSYESAVAASPSLLARLRSLTSDNPVQQRRLDELNRHVDHKLAELQETVRLFQADNVHDARRLVESGTGARTMDQIRGILEDIEREEQTLLATRSALSNQSASRTISVVVFSAFLQVLLILAVILLLRRALLAQQLAARLDTLKALEFGREQLQSFIEHTPVAVAMLDRDLRYLHVSRRWLEEYGLGDRTIIGQCHYDVFPAIHEKPEWRDVHRRCLEGAVERCDEDAVACADGSMDWLRWEVRPWRDQDGSVGGIILFIENITARKRAEEFLRRSHGVLEEQVRERTVELQRTTEILRVENEARRRDQETLRKTSEEVRDLYDNAPCGYHSLDKDGTIVAINNTELVWLGYRREEVVGRMTFADFLTADGRAKFQEKFPEFKERGWVRDLEFEMVRKDGSRLLVLLNSTAITDAAGRYVSSRSTVFDITERKRAEAILAASQREMRRTFDLLDATRDGLFIFDADTLRFSYVNLGAVNQVGYSRDELLTMTPLDIKPEYTEAQFRAMIAPLLAGAQDVHCFETVHRRKDGADVPVEINLQCMPGATPTLVALVRDITERKQTEERAVKLLEKLKVATHAARIGIWDWNITKDELIWDDLMYALYRISRSKFDSVYNAWLNCVHPDDQPYCHEAIQKALRGEREYDIEFRIRWPDGANRVIKANGLVVRDAEGIPVRMTGTNFDITDRKHAEEEIRRRGELLEAANKELEAFSYSVSHDLRAPLRSIDGFSKALLEDCAGKLNRQEQDYLNRVRAASQRMGQLIDDLLQLSRLTRQELRRESVDLSAMALSRAEEVRKLWPNRHVQLLVESGLKAQGDRRLLEVLFDNLLGNAWKFTGKRDGATVNIGAIAHNGTPAFFVRDNGAGFDMAYAGKLFGAFQRLHAMTDYPGTGIGLATVQRIVARHGGRIWAEGRVNEGATFYFTLGECEGGTGPTLKVLDDAAVSGAGQGYNG